MPTSIKTEETPPVFAAPTVPELLQALEEKDHIIAEQQKLLRLMEEKLRLAKLQRFGASSEKLAFQGDFFDEAELETALSDLEHQLADDQPPPKRARKQRIGFSDTLPRVRVELTLSKEEKQGAVKTFFTKVKEELDIIPAQAQVIEYWQEKAVFDTEHCRATPCAPLRQMHRQRATAGLHSGVEVCRCLAFVST